MFDRRKIVFIICLCLGLVGISLYVGQPANNNSVLIGKEQLNTESPISSYDNKNKSTSNIKVSLTGAVVNPGIYELNKGARVEDLLSIAGGVLDTADHSKLNEAKILRDGMLINIPFAKQPKEPKDIKESKENHVTTTLVNINTASVQELVELPNIGPVLAERIVQHRNQNGSFHSKKDLLKVKGIGTSILSKISNKISL